ncbi:MAG: DUF2993 domain-containing protein [Cellulomonadaceae bacterium]|nr:DUF2993 domain-containing protein [Cellulomonadaceae bacterium]
MESLMGSGTDLTADSSSGNMAVEVAGPPSTPPRKRRWVRRLVIVVAALLALLVAGDRLALVLAQRTVADAVTQAASEHGGTVEDLSVSMGGFPFLTQLAGGSLQDVNGGAARGTFGGYEMTDIQVHAEGIAPTSPFHVDNATVSGIIGFSTLAHVVKDQVGTDVDLNQSTDEGDGALHVSIDVLGVFVGATVNPRVVDKATIGIDVVNVKIAGATVALADIPFDLGDRLTNLTVPLELPPGIALKNVTVEPTGLKVTATATDVKLAELTR